MIQNNGSTIGMGLQKVYDMGSWWSGGGHPGGNLIAKGYINSNNKNTFNWTNVLKNRHGSSEVWRLGNATYIGNIGDDVPESYRI